jgi:multidrug transporter EmrE-like cation transporter
MGYVLLFVAIVAEVIAVVALRMSQGFSRVLPTVTSLAGFAVTLWLLALAIKTVPLSISYPTWAGVGTIGALTAAYLLFDERLRPVQLLGVAAVVVGVVLVHAPNILAGEA